MFQVSFLRYNADMEHISQTDLHTALEYDPTTGVFTWIRPTSRCVKAGQLAGDVKKHGYLMIGFGGKRHLAHRLAWFYVHGVWPEHEIDHINRNRLDNRLVNLRCATRSENAKNVGARVKSSSGLKGVSWDKAHEKWRAQTRINGKKKYIGLFDTKEAAYDAYKNFCDENAV